MSTALATFKRTHGIATHRNRIPWPADEPKRKTKP
jgi:hypothetical protein